MVTRENVDAITADRSAIMQNAINTRCGVGRMPALIANAMNTFANLVFYEPGWDWKIAEQSNGKPEFFVRSYSPEN